MNMKVLNLSKSLSGKFWTRTILCGGTKFAEFRQDQDGFWRSLREITHKSNAEEDRIAKAYIKDWIQDNREILKNYENHR